MFKKQILNRLFNHYKGSPLDLRGDLFQLGQVTANFALTHLADTYFQMYGLSKEFSPHSFEAWLAWVDDLTEQDLYYGFQLTNHDVVSLLL